VSSRARRRLGEGKQRLRLASAIACESRLFCCANTRAHLHRSSSRCQWVPPCALLRRPWAATLAAVSPRPRSRAASSHASCSEEYWKQQYGRDGRDLTRLRAALRATHGRTCVHAVLLEHTVVIRSVPSVPSLGKCSAPRPSTCCPP
jgi:hypothetical protein